MPSYRYAEPSANPYAGTIGDLLARRNEPRARAMDIAGQAWGRAIQQAGQIGAGTIAAIDQERREAPLRAQQAEMARIELDAAREGVAAKRQRRQRDQVFMHWLGQGKQPTPRDMLSIGFSPDEVANYGQGLQAFEALEQKRSTDARADVARVANMFGQHGPEVQAAMWPQLRQKAIEAGAPDIPEAAGAEGVRGVLAWATGRDIATEEAKRAQEAQKAQLEATATMEEIAARNRDDQRADRQGEATAAHQRAVLAEETRHNRAMEARPTGGQPSYSWAMDPNTGKVERVTDSEIRARGLTQAPTADMRNKELSKQTAARAVSAVKELGSRILTKVGPAQRIEAVKRGAEAIWGTDPEFRTYQDARMALAGTLAVEQQGSRVSDADVKALWLPMVPDAYRDTKESNEIKWTLIDTMRGIEPGSSEAGAGGGGAPKEGDRKEIPGYPGTEQTYRNGKWIRTR